MEFSNHVAIITGAGQGIGFEIASALCAEGAAVVLNDVDADLAYLSSATLKVLIKGFTPLNPFPKSEKC